MEKRDHIVHFINHWQGRTGFPRQQFLDWIELPRGRFRDWEKRLNKKDNHNAPLPKAHWILPEEKEAITRFAQQGNLQAGYRRMTYLMLDADIVAVSPSTVYRVLKEADLIQPWGKPSKKGTGFVQPLMPHEHWHTDFTYLKINGIFYFLTTILDGASRAILSWHLKSSMTEIDAAIVLQKAREAYPDQKPRIISDNGKQYLAKDFQDFLYLCEMTHVKTAPYYPQSNGKIERFHKSIKQEALRPFSPVDLQDAQRIIDKYIHDYNNVRLHSAIGYVPPILVLEGKAEQRHEERRKKLKTASEKRKNTIPTNPNKTFSSKEENDKQLLLSDEQVSRNPAGRSSCTNEPLGECGSVKLLTRTVLDS